MGELSSNAGSIRVGIYADDLTGSLDAAAPFAARGMSTYVSVFGIVPDHAARSHRVLSLNIDTRHADRFPVFDRAARAAKELRSAGFDMLVNKIDSTMRGHAGLEARAGLSGDPSDASDIESAGQWAGPRVALIAPTFPAMGRTVDDGLVRVDGRPLADSEVGQDPLSPVSSSDISELVHANTGASPAHIGLDVVRDVERLRAVVTEMSRNPPVLAVSDAVTNDDLANIAMVAAETVGEVILSGSAGITGALAQRLSEDVQLREDKAESSDSGALIVSGSQRTISRRQLQVAAEDELIDWVELDPASLVNEGVGGELRDRTVNRLADSISRGGHAAASLSQDGETESITPSARTRLVRELGAVAYRVARRCQPGALVLVGGDTTQAVLRAAGSAGIVLQGEPFPGVPMGRVDGGLFDGTAVVTKAGAFGTDETLNSILDYLSGKRPTGRYDRAHQGI